MHKFDISIFGFRLRATGAGGIVGAIVATIIVLLFALAYQAGA